MHSDIFNSGSTEASCEMAYRDYGSLLYRLCYSFLSSRADAEDAVQETFYRFMKKAPAFREEEHRKAWFIHVASNVCRDMLRRRGVRAADELDEATEPADQPDGGHEVLKCIYSLPEKYKLVFILHYLEENSVSDTAKYSGLSESAVKMRLARGRELLREKLKAEGLYNA